MRTPQPWSTAGTWGTPTLMHTAWAAPPLDTAITATARKDGPTIRAASKSAGGGFTAYRTPQRRG